MATAVPRATVASKTAGRPAMREVKKPSATPATPTAARLWIVVALAALFGLYWALAALSPNVIGLWQDDAIYVSTAKALAQGDGYRHIELPAQPFQTKYPILYPALLAAVWLIAPNYPGNVWLLLLPTAAAGAATIVLCAVYWRVVFRSPQWFTLLVAVFAAFSPVMLAFARYAMSEFIYAALAVGGLLCIDHGLARATRRRSRLAWAAAGALLAGLAVLTRSIGVTLSGAMLLTLLLRRQWRELAVAAVVLAACAAPWSLWQSWAAEQNGAQQTALLQSASLDYKLWVPEHLGQTLRVMNQNLWRMSLGMGFFQLGLPREFAGRALVGGGWPLVFVHVVCHLASLLVIAGFVSTLRRGWQCIHVYAAAYALMLLVWPFEPYRFMVPWTPFILYFMFRGVRSAAAVAGNPLRRGGRRARAGPAGRPAEGSERVLHASPGNRTHGAPGVLAVCVAAGLVAIPFAREDALIFASDLGDYYMRENPPELIERRHLHAWLRNVSPRNAVVACNPGEIYLNTGRRGYVYWPDRDPYTLYYGPQRAWRQFYAISPAGVDEDRAVYQQMKPRWVDAYRSAGVTHFVHHRYMNESQALARLIGEFRENFEPVYVTPGGVYRVYRIRYPAP